VDRIDSYLGKHLWAQIVLSLLVASAVSMLLFPERSFGTTLVRTAVISAGGIAIMVAMRRKEERAAGGSADRLVTLERKLRKGDVPVDPQERRAMRGLVEQRLHRTRHRVAAQVFLVVLFCAAVMATAATSGPRQTIGLAVFSGAFLSWLIFYGNRRHRRLRTMRDALAAETSGACDTADRSR
jgi:Flp pilus assembly protein TadB